MNTKRIAALVTLGALLSTAGPAVAAAPTGTVQVEWNYAVTATLTMYTQTSASKTHWATPGNDIYTLTNGGAGQCNGTATSPSSDASATGTVNFGNVAADTTDYTECLEINAIDANYVTNDSKGADFTVAVTAGAPSDYDTATNGSLLCILPDGFTVGATAAEPAWAISTRAAAVVDNSTTACPAGDLAVTGTAQPLFNGNNSTTNADLNQDLQLSIGPQMQSGQQTLTVTYTMTTN